MRGFSSLFCDNGPEKPCSYAELGPHALIKLRRGAQMEDSAVLGPCCRLGQLSARKPVHVLCVL